LHIYHTLITASAHNAFIDTGIPARGLHGEAYRGHIFWDEMFILPIYFMNLPETAKSVLLYRYRRLDKARASAKECGFNGAMFPWQSGSDGQEETQVLHLNPLSGKWGPDHSFLQRHVSLAIAYNIWQYFNFTADLKFLEDYGAEMFLEICRFWASKAQFNKKTKRFDIDRIMGPDEYHEVYPNSKEGGLKNNSYTNIMIIWIFNRVPDILNLLEGSKVQNLFKKIGLKQDELSFWEKISTDLSIPISEDGILEQFDGYFKLKEFDWKKYKAKYGKINRLDRILKAEGKNPDDYKVAKQADVLMSFYNLEEDEVKNIIGQTGYTPQENLLYKNFDYYFKRTSHGSTLSKLVHSYLAGIAGHDNLSYQLYSDALISDFQDVQGGSVKEGIHTGVMGGSVFLALKSYAGFKIKDNKIHLNPKLPATWKEMYFTFKFREYRYYFEITPQKIRTRTEKRNQMDDSLFINLQEIKLKGNSWQVVELDQRENK
jgi:trehalose/maltose hydrolase-like predicted phosphorylase